MFDIDGTLIESADFDSECFTEAVKEVTGFDIDTDSYALPRWRICRR
jgi:beta-phosphoglucomutase-like phosphatase (HAD superfamily)